MATLSERIRYARKVAGFTQSELSKRLGVWRGAVTQWEHPCGTRPSMKHLIAIAQQTGVSFDWLGTGRGEAINGLPPQEEPAPMEAIKAHDEVEEECLRLFREMPRRLRDQIVALMRVITH